MRRFLSFFSGALIGGLIGSVLVLLFTPEKGEDIRSRLCSYSHNTFGEIKEAANHKRLELEMELQKLRSK